MNLLLLAQMQSELDERIVVKQELEGQDLLIDKILALQVELGELANEWRGFKFWSTDQEPRTEKMLEEYVDCLHFILSMGIELGHEKVRLNQLSLGEPFLSLSISEAFLDVFWYVQQLYTRIDSQRGTEGVYKLMLESFLNLGFSLGLSLEKIQEAYISKNSTNHQRQENRY